MFKHQVTHLENNLCMYVILQYHREFLEKNLMKHGRTWANIKQQIREMAANASFYQP